MTPRPVFEARKMATDSVLAARGRSTDLYQTGDVVYHQGLTVVVNQRFTTS